MILAGTDEIGYVPKKPPDIEAWVGRSAGAAQHHRGWRGPIYPIPGSAKSQVSVRSRQQRSGSQRRGERVGRRNSIQWRWTLGAPTTIAIPPRATASRPLTEHRPGGGHSHMAESDASRAGDLHIACLGGMRRFAGSPGPGPRSGRQRRRVPFRPCKRGQPEDRTESTGTSTDCAPIHALGRAARFISAAGSSCST
jgi:hypothetical protein